ncbi:hypothetical protein ACVILK_003185 [Bradyrhizobium embrapense]
MLGARAPDPQKIGERQVVDRWAGGLGGRREPSPASSPAAMVIRILGGHVADGSLETVTRFHIFNGNPYNGLIINFWDNR